jgi:hypothetical protein
MLLSHAVRLDSASFVAHISPLSQFVQYEMVMSRLPCAVGSICLGTQVGETLDVIMREMIGDSNWLRLWAANGNDDGDSLTPTISHPDQLQAGSMPNPSQPSHGNPFHVGNIYEVQVREGGISQVVGARVQVATLAELL